MASAETKARWLRYANRCFLEEDYEGALRKPRSPSFSSKPETERSPDDGSKIHELPAGTKWWLNQSEHPSIYLLRQLNVLETDICSKPTMKLSGKSQFNPKEKGGSLWNPSRGAFAMCMDNEDDVGFDEFEAVTSDSFGKKSMNDDTGEFLYEDDHKLSSEEESHWIGVLTAEPWWRRSDNELASYVSLKSSEHFENCDLPQPRRKRTKHFDQDKGLASLDQQAEEESYKNNDSMIRTPSSVSLTEAVGTPEAVGCSPCGLDVPSRNNERNTTESDKVENLHMPNSGLSKAQLLEALCHSQSRARKAETMAQEAQNKKEDVIRLFLRQASQLFAYQQWFHILQLENLCLQLRDSKNNPIHTVLVPWVPSKGKQSRRRKAARQKPGPPRYKVSPSVGAFLLGLTLAGAGLLLGWSLGWLCSAV